ncbi:hypothetical protein AB6D83_10470 [Vibrio cyclitrophicus]
MKKIIIKLLSSLFFFKDIIPRFFSLDVFYHNNLFKVCYIGSSFLSCTLHYKCINKSEYQKEKLKSKSSIFIEINSPTEVKVTVSFIFFKVCKKYFLSNFDKKNLEIGNVYHAFGKIDELVYTNSEEAFLNNYKKGVRVFEVDLYFHNDEVYLFHPEKNYCGEVWLPSIDRSTELESFLYDGKYRVLKLNDLFDIMARYRDVKIVIDIKKGLVKSSVINTLAYRVNRANNHVSMFRSVGLFSESIRRSSQKVDMEYRTICCFSNFNLSLDIKRRLIPQVDYDNIGLFYKLGIGLESRIFRYREGDVNIMKEYASSTNCQLFSISYSNYRYIDSKPENVSFLLFGVNCDVKCKKGDVVGYYVD